MRRTLIVVSLTLATVCVFATTASAAIRTVCIGDHPLCPGGVTHQSASSTILNNELEDAGEDPDGLQVFLGPGSFQHCGGFSVNSSSKPFSLIGAGASSTLITGCNGADPIFAANLQSRSSTISGIGFSVSAAMSGSNPQVSITKGTLRDSAVTVVNQNVDSIRPAVKLDSSDMSGTTVRSSDSVGVSTSGAATSSISDSTISGISDALVDMLGTAITSSSDAAISRVKISAAANHVVSTTGGNVQISDSLLSLGSNNVYTTGLRAGGSGSSASLLVADRMTIVGSGLSKVGVQVGGDGGPALSGLTITDSLIDLPGGGSVAGGCYRSSTSVPTQLNFVRTAYVSTKVSNPNAPATPCASYTPSDSDYFTDTQPIGFVDAAAGDYHLRYDSPFLNAGASSVPSGALDLDGKPRLVRDPRVSQADPTRVDLGAFEYQASAPVATIAGPDLARPNKALVFSAAATDADPGEVPMLAWNFGDGAVAGGASITHAFAKEGTYSVALSATDPAGLVGSASKTVRIDGTAPKIKITKKPKTASKKAAVSFKASETATFQCKLDKAKKWAKCKSPWKKTVKPGKHKLQVRATDAAGNVSKTTTVRWTVKKKR
ncbi:MAG: PKD domain-containing protein [Solirubrobacterales bacterium]